MASSTFPRSSTATTATKSARRRSRWACVSSQPTRRIAAPG